jgi:cell division protein FtsX
MGRELGLCSLLLRGLPREKKGQLVATVSLVTSVFISKAEALAVLEESLGLKWFTDDPADVTLPLPEGAWISIEVPHYGEDLPLTLDVHHHDVDTLDQVATELQESLRTTLGWDTIRLG